MNIKTLLFGIVALLPAVAMAELFDDYTMQPSFSLDILGTPQGGTLLSNLSDGRMVAVLTDQATATPRVYVESTTGSRSFNFVTNLDLGSASWSSTGAFAGGSFLEASPGGAATRRFAVGNGIGTHAVIFTEQNLLSAETTGNLSTSVFAVSQFSATWQNDQDLAVNGGPFGGVNVTLLDTNSPTATPAIATILNSGITASGGIAFDAAGNLYLGEGFGANVGAIRKFSNSEVQTAINTNTPLAFNDGMFIGNVLAASPLVFDAEGNLFVGGGDVFDFVFDASEEDFFALIEGVTDGAFDPNNPNIRQFGTPDASDGSASFFITRNDVTGEIYVHQPFDPVDVNGVLVFPDVFDIDNQLFQVFAAPNSFNSVPEPTSIVGALICAIAAFVGYRLTRREPA